MNLLLWCLFTVLGTHPRSTLQSDPLLKPGEARVVPIAAAVPGSGDGRAVRCFQFDIVPNSVLYVSLVARERSPRLSFDPKSWSLWVSFAEEPFPRIAGLAERAKGRKTLRIFVPAGAPNAGEEATLYLNVLPAVVQTPEGRVAFAAAIGKLERSLELNRKGEIGEAALLEDQAIGELLAIPGVPDSYGAVKLFLDLAPFAQLQHNPRLALKAWEKALEIYELALHPAHYQLLAVKGKAARLVPEVTGDLRRAIELEEEIEEGMLAAHGPNDFNLQVARLNLAGHAKEEGDLVRARLLEEQALAALAALDQSNEMAFRNTESVRANLAGTLFLLGDAESSLSLLQEARETLLQRFAAEDFDVIVVDWKLAAVLANQEEYERARAIDESILERLEAELPDHDLLLQLARANYAHTLQAFGEQEKSRGLLVAALVVLERAYGASHPDVLGAREKLLWSLAALGERDALDREAAALDGGVRAALGAALSSLSQREIQAKVSELEHKVATLLSLAGPNALLRPAEDWQRRSFALVESLRGAGFTGLRLVHRLEDAGVLAEARQRRAAVRESAAALAGLAEGDCAVEVLQRAASSHDRAERRLAELVDQHLEPLDPLRSDLAGEIAAVLNPRQAAVGFWRYERMDLFLPAGKETEVVPSFLAFVLRNGSPLQRVELGPAQAIEEAVAAWRSNPDDLESGWRLRELVFDPWAMHLEGVDELILAPDDVLHLIALDALPAGNGFVGDRLRVRVLPRLGELLEPKKVSEASVGLLAFGNIDYDAAPGGAEGRLPGTAGAAAAAPLGTEAAVDVIHRGVAGHRFDALDTLQEIQEIEKTFQARFGPGAATLVVQAAAAGRSAFEEQAPRARFIHLATHAFFVDQAKALNPAAHELFHGFGRQPSFRGMAPFALSALVFTGANRWEKTGGRFTGLLTGLELAGLDLSACELAVLAACETHLGERRAGTGIASLQSALHAAGAQTALTSLWPVEDHPARDFMVRFYQMLWKEGLPAPQAVWQAKRQLRSLLQPDGSPQYRVRDWAGWVLTGGE